MQKQIKSVLRDAVINNVTREGVYNEMNEKLGCDRPTAKKLLFSFLYNADEEYLQAVLKGEDEGKYSWRLDGCGNYVLNS